MITTIKDGKLIIELPLNSTPQQSKSGKTMIVAGTGGFAKTSAQIAGKTVSVAVNATVPVP